MFTNFASRFVRFATHKVPFGRYQYRFQNIRSLSTCDGLTLDQRDRVLWIKFDRPKKLNSITKDMYCHITKTLKEVNDDKTLMAVVLTGQGDYYSSGNDLSNLAMAMQDPDGPRAGLTKSTDILREFVDAIINLDKFILAGVNGPAIGIPVTTLPLFDYVLASDKATFQTPFTALGQCPEACSSVTLPQIMGRTRANELLLLNMVWTAKKAQSYGLVSEVVESDKFSDHLETLVYGKKGIVKNCYPHSLAVSKSLTMNSITRKQLEEVNRRECDAILELWLGEECRDAVQKFFQRSSK